MPTMAQIRDREQRLREALRVGVCTEADTVAVCLDRLAARDRLAAAGPDLVAFVQRLVAMLEEPDHEGHWVDDMALLEDARVLLARAAGETEARDG